MIVKINSTVVSDDMGLQIYRSIIPFLLTKGKSEQESILSSILYYRDTPSYDENDTSKNSGFATRVKLAAGSKTFDLVGPLNTPIFTQTRYIPPGCSIEVKLVRNLPEFCLQSPATQKSGVSGVPYVFSLEECNLVVRSISVHPDIVRQHQILFSKNGRAQFPITQFETRVAQIGAGTSTFISEVLWNGRLPIYAIFGLLDSSAFLGSLDKSPVNFKPYGLSSITIKAEHDIQIYQTISVDFDIGNYQTAYQSIFDCLSNRETGNNISRDLYVDGYTYYAFHLIPPAVGSELLPERRGSMKVIILCIFVTLLRINLTLV